MTPHGTVHAQPLSRHRGGARTDLYAVHREGAGQVPLIGPPNAGESSLLESLTGAAARVAEYAFTTQLPQPAMMPFEDIQVQLVDLPAMSSGATPAWMHGLVQAADLLLLLIDLDADPTTDLQAIRSELEAFHVLLKDPAAPDRPEEGVVSRSATSGKGVEALRQRIVQALNVVRVYAKPPGRPPESGRPFVLHRGATVEDLADVIHHELRQKLTYALRWPAEGSPLRVAHDYVLHDRDVIE